jgi:glutamate formiminotransferase
VLECVVNISEGRNAAVLGGLAAKVAGCLLDLHVDAVHNRSVFTLAGDEVETAARELARSGLECLDIAAHAGVHPRLGVVDVVPFVPLAPADSLEVALGARTEFSSWFGNLGVPCFEYGPDLSLPDVRRHAWIDLFPDTGPPEPHPTAGACCVGARRILVAYNVWLAEGGVAEARAVARSIRRPGIRALGLDIDGQGQVAMNLVDPLEVGPAAAYDLVAAEAHIHHAELVGLVPNAVLEAVPRQRWTQLGLSESATIEARLHR